MSANAESKRYGVGDGGWEVATGSGATGHNRAVLADCPLEVVESCTEQPWAEFCSGLDRPAFLLPITGFAEL